MEENGADWVHWQRYFTTAEAEATMLSGVYMIITFSSSVGMLCICERLRPKQTIETTYSKGKYERRKEN